MLLTKAWIHPTVLIIFSKYGPLYDDYRFDNFANVGRQFLSLGGFSLVRWLTVRYLRPSSFDQISIACLRKWVEGGAIGYRSNRYRIPSSFAQAKLSVMEAAANHAMLDHEVQRLCKGSS